MALLEQYNSYHQLDNSYHHEEDLTHKILLSQVTRLTVVMFFNKN